MDKRLLRYAAGGGAISLLACGLLCMVLGALALFARWTDGRRAAREKAAARAMVAATCAVTLAALVMKMAVFIPGDLIKLAIVTLAAPPLLRCLEKAGYTRS